MEKKTFVGPLEIKSLEDNGVFEGYGSVFGNVDSYGDIVMPGAFAKSLSKKTAADVKLLWQHDPSQPIGVYESIQEQAKGLYVKGRLLVGQVQKASEAYALMKSGAVSGLSIGYTTNKATSTDQGTTELNDLDLWEISVVTFPANTQATISAVKHAENIKTIRDFEKHLRDLGFSQRQAVAIASSGFKAIESKDVHREDEALTQDLLKSLSNLTNVLKGCN